VFLTPKTGQKKKVKVIVISVARKDRTVCVPLYPWIPALPEFITRNFLNQIALNYYCDIPGNLSPIPNCGKLHELASCSVAQKEAEGGCYICLSAVGDDLRLGNPN
jgi:hypothetical protein